MASGGPELILRAEEASAFQVGSPVTAAKQGIPTPSTAGAAEARAQQLPRM